MYKKIIQLKRNGFSYARIAERLGIPEDEVRSIKGIKHIYPEKKFDGIGDNPEEIPLFIRENLAKRLEEEKEEKACGEKEWKWRLTHFRNLKDFTLLTSNV